MPIVSREKQVFMGLGGFIMVNTCVHCAWSAIADNPHLWCKNKESKSYNVLVKYDGHCAAWTRFEYESRDHKRPGQLALEEEMAVGIK